MKLVIGLGNPGKDYANTRHNAGFLALDTLAGELGAKWSTDTKLKSSTAKIQLGDQSVLLAKPKTFMNLSGEAVRALAAYYKVKPQDILIIQDEMDLAPGSFKFSLIGGTGGHNGIASIFEQLHVTKIPRLRIGIGRPPKPMASEDYVLQAMDEETVLTCKKMTGPITDWITLGLDRAMNTHHQTTPS